MRPALRHMMVHALVLTGMLLSSPQASAQAFDPETALDADRVDEDFVPPILIDPTLLEETVGPVETLMFSLEEYFEIRAAIAESPMRDLLAATVERERRDAEDFAEVRLRQNVHLSAILYETPSAWSLWINGRAVSPQRPSPYFDVLRVTPDYAEISVPWRDGTRDVRIAPNQTYLYQSGQVVDRRIR